MNHGVSGYDAARIHPYRPIERQPEAKPAQESERPERGSQATSSDRVDLGPDLSEAEAHMIGQAFPESDRVKLRLYGPGRTATSVDPGERGRRLDLRG